jgi:hypothetical protein
MSANATCVTMQQHLPAHFSSNQVLVQLRNSSHNRLEGVHSAVESNELEKGGLDSRVTNLKDQSHCHERKCPIMVGIDV